MLKEDIVKKIHNIYKNIIGDWQPDYSNINLKKHVIKNKRKFIYLTVTYSKECPLAFPNENKRKDFLALCTELEILVYIKAYKK